MILAKNKIDAKRYVAPKILMDVDRFSVNVGYFGGLRNRQPKVWITVSLSCRDNTIDLQDTESYKLQIDLDEARTLRDRLTRQIESGEQFEKTGEFASSVKKFISFLEGDKQ